MIEKSEIISLVASACPSFSMELDDHLREYGNDMLYAVAGSLAHHLLMLHRTGRTEEFPAVAALIERLHIEGSSEVKELATIGILEDIQNVWSDSGEDPEQFGKILGPESTLYWQSLNHFWRNITSTGDNIQSSD